MSDGWINPYDTPELNPPELRGNSAETPPLMPPPDYIEPPPLDDPEAEARRQGYSWPEIKDYIGSATATALQHGYSAREIDDFLGRKDPGPFEARARAGWLGSMAGDPSLLETIEPAASPTMREDYADALLAGEVRGPEDFAYRYTAAALDAAHNGMGLDDSNAQAVRERQTEGALAADALAGELPSREDLIDAALALTAGDREADHDQVRGNLMDHWLATGQDPAHAALQAQYDAGLSDKLTAPPPLPEPTFWERYGALTATAADAEFAAGQLVVQHFQGIVKDAGDWGVAQQAIADRMEGKPLADWVRDPEAMQTAFSAAFALMPANLEGSIASIVRRMREPNIAVTDLTKLLGEAIGEAPISEALKPVEPAGLMYKKAAGYEAGEPPPIAIQAPDVLEHPTIPQGSVRLYRVEGGGEPSRVPDWLKDTEEFKNTVSSTGRWFTNDFNELDFYRRDRGAGHRIVAVDVPAAEAERYRVSNIALNIDRVRAENPAFYSSRPEKEFFLPAEVAAGKRELPAGLDPNASPAQKIARIAQDAGEETPGANFFENKLAEMGETDPATVALGKSHDALARFGKWLSDVFHDESGAGPGITPPSATVTPGTYRARAVGKNFAEDLIRRISTGLGTQRSEHIAQGFEQFFKDLSPFMPRFRQEMAKPYGGAWADTEIGRVLRAAEGDGVIAADHAAAPYTAWRAQENRKLVADIEAAVARGDLNRFQAREFYLAHMYTPDSLGGRGVSGGGRTGSAGWARERTLPTYADAFAEGYKPKYDNPILIDIASLDAHYKLLDAVRMQGIAREANWMRYYTDPREAARDHFHPLNGVNSEKAISTIKPDGTPGEPITQLLYGREGFERIWNNWVGFENLSRSAAVATFEDALLKVKNASTYAKLLFPGFHTFTEYKLGVSNGVANALSEIGYALRLPAPGDTAARAAGAPTRLGELARGMRDAVIAPFKPVEYVATSAAKWRGMYRRMEADPALDAYVGGGGGFAARSKVYSASDAPGIWKLWSRGQLFQEAAAEMRRDFTFPSTRAGDGRWGVAGGVARDVTNLATLPLRSAAYGVTNATAWVWDQMIPLLKGGAAIERIQTFIRQNPLAGDDLVRNYAQRVVTNIEDRFGEYNQANLFWRPWMKRIANQTMLSTGWTYGTVHATMEGLRLGRGFAWNPVATTNLMGQFATIAFTNAAWTLAVDGKLPSSTLDYIIPFASARGLARVLLPGEEKEYWDWLKIVGETFGAYKTGGVGGAFRQFAQSTWEYGEGKLAPIYQAASAFVTGIDRIGHHIADQPGGLMKFLEQSFAPIFIENWAKAKAIDLGVVGNLFGVREAPKQLSDFWGFVGKQEQLHERWTKEELQRAGREALAIGQEPPEGYRTPRQAGGGRGGGGSGAAPASPISSPGIASYAAPQGSGYGGVADTSGGTPVYRGGSYGGGGRRIALPRGRARTPRPANLLPARLRTKNRRGF